PAGRPDRRHRPRDGDRGGHRERAQGPGRRADPGGGTGQRGAAGPGAGGAGGGGGGGARGRAGAPARPPPPPPAPASPWGAGRPLGGGAAAGLRRAQIGVSDIGLRRPTLDDVFLQLTGAPPSQDGSGPAPRPRRRPPPQPPAPHGPAPRRPALRLPSPQTV